MTLDEKKKILELKKSGLGYKAIAKEIGISIGSIQNFFRNGALIDETTNCKCCGKEITLIPKMKKRVFCSVECKTKWWNKHHDELKNKTMHQFVCLGCGCSFEIYGVKTRKYCSYDCYYKNKNKVVCSDENI